MTRRRAFDPRDDTGSTLLLTIFYGAMALVVVLLVVGAEAFDLADVSITDGAPRVTLDSASVATSVEEYVSSNRLAPVEDLKIEDASSSDGTSASVTLSGYWRPPVFTLLIPDGLRIEVTAVARSVFL
jgi:hypothetical protein